MSVFHGNFEVKTDLFWWKSLNDTAPYETRYSVYGILGTLDEPELPVVPQFVADIIKQTGTNIERNKEYVIRSVISQFYVNDFETNVWEWFDTTGNLILFIRAVENGYTVEPPKTMQVIIKNYDETVFETELPINEANKLIKEFR